MKEIGLYAIKGYDRQNKPLKTMVEMEKLSFKFKTVLLQSQSKMLKSFVQPSVYNVKSFSQLYGAFGDYSLFNFLSGQPTTVSKIPGANEYFFKKAYEQYQLESSKAMHKEPLADSSFHKNASIQSLVQEVAKKNNLPKEWFKKLIHMESGFDPLATSRKGALGLGQLMPATASEMGLRVTSPDDRSEGSVWDPGSNLDASARYLRWLQEVYLEKGMKGREMLNFTAAAYNAGIGNIQKAINRVGNKDSLTWQKVASVLPIVTGRASKETIQYVERLQSSSIL